MELLQLKYFCDAAITQNFSVTAKKFMVPPSNISQSVKRLERELKIELFDRKANSIKLNENGRAFFEKISESLRLIDEATNSVSDSKNCGKITICVNAHRRIVIQAVEKFTRNYPNVVINAEYSADVVNPEFDLVITGKTLDLPHLAGKKIATEEICLAVPADSELSKFDTVDVGGLKNESFVAMGEKSDMHELTKRICANFGFEPHIAIQGDDPFYVRKCVEMGLGISFVPMLSWKGQFSDRVVLKSIGGYTRDVYIYKNSKKHLSKYVSVFLEMLVAEFDFETK